jgi:NB-ARC domain/WD domain, G-beta repeat
MGRASRRSGGPSKISGKPAAGRAKTRGGRDSVHAVPRNLDFVGRSDDLDRLHAVLQARRSAGIRPAGLTGMGGIGKTQLAVEYVYRHRDDYPGGLFWVNAVEPLAQGLAQVGARLRPETLDQSPNHQLRAAFEELSRRPDALIVFDNLDDPAQLDRTVALGVTPSTLPCRILFTTRRPDLGRFQPVEVSVLPDEPTLQLLLRHESRRAVRDDPKHPERPEAESICRLVGSLPLAVEVAGAFLAEWPDESLADYRKRLQKKGCLPTFSKDAAELAAALEATLQTQWDALKPGDDAARLLLRVAGQFAEAANIPEAILGLFAGVSGAGEPGDPSPLKRALKRLHDVRLVEKLEANRVRLHPLVREFAAALTPQAETAEFRQACACRVSRAFEDVSAWEDLACSDGIEGIERCLDVAQEFAGGAEDSAGENLASMLRLARREAHHLREWDPQSQPNAFAQQVLFRAVTLGVAPLAESSERRLGQLASPRLLLRWRTFKESHALVRVLSGHLRAVDSVAVSPDGRRIASGSSDHTVAVWDLESGARIHRLEGHQDWVDSVAVSPDGRRIASGSWDQTVAVWDLESGDRLATLAFDADVLSVAWHRDGRSIVAGDAGGDLYRLEYRER